MKKLDILAVHYALKIDGGLDFLRLLYDREFDLIRKNWPDIPEKLITYMENDIGLSQQK